MKVSYAMCTKRKLVLLALQPFQQFSVFIQELRLLCAKPGAGQLPGGRDQHEDMLWTVHPSEQSLSPGKFRLRRVTSIRSLPHLSTLLEEGVSSAQGTSVGSNLSGFQSTSSVNSLLAPQALSEACS